MIDLAERKRKLFLYKKKNLKKTRIHIAPQEFQYRRAISLAKLFWLHKVVVKRFFHTFLNIKKEINESGDISLNNETESEGEF